MKETINFWITRDGLARLRTRGYGVDRKHELVPLQERDRTEEGVPAVVTEVRVLSGSPLIDLVKEVQQECDEAGETFLVTGSVVRQYTRREIKDAAVLCLKIRGTFEPAGEECGTAYDDSGACGICGSGGRQVNELILPRAKIPRKDDIAMTIASEFVVSRQFVVACEQSRLRGLKFLPIRDAESGMLLKDWRQLVPESSSAEVVAPTSYGTTPFDVFGGDFSQERRTKVAGYVWDSLSRNIPAGAVGAMMVAAEGPAGVMRCPNGDKIGGIRFSELHVKLIGADESDFFATRQFVGLRSGFVRPYRELLFSQRMSQVLLESGMKGLDVEPVHVVEGIE